MCTVVVTGITDKGRAVVEWYRWLEAAHPGDAAVFSPYAAETDCGFAEWLAAGAVPARMAAFFRPVL